jgi:hypothetical protein
MALNPSGVMSIGGTTVGASINLELNLAADANSSIGQTNFRELAKVPTGAISLSDFYGKSNVTIISITEDTTSYVLSPEDIPDYVEGETKVELNVSEGVYLYSTSTSTPALLITGFATGDTVKIVNNGFIIGMGGMGGNAGFVNKNGGVGGTAISLAFPVTVENNSYIAGGGGGGACGYDEGGGGGGAGGGQGGQTFDFVLGGAGGAPGMAGQNGGIRFDGFMHTGAGGGGGRILFPGFGGLGGTNPDYAGKGGGTGGGGGWSGIDPSEEGRGGNGGNANSPGESTWPAPFPPGPDKVDYSCGAGGGGWGASGGRADPWQGGVGGKAIALNGNTLSASGSGFFYGAVS